MAGVNSRHCLVQGAVSLAACLLLLATGCSAERDQAATRTGIAAAAAPPAPDAAQAQRLLQSPQVRDWQARQRFRSEARDFLRTAESLPVGEREQRAAALEAQIARRERAGELSAGEAMLLRTALLQARSTSDAEQARSLAALAEHYRQDAARREAAWIASQQSDPRMQQYKARERVVVAEVMAMQTIPGGLARDEYLRQRLQEERERAWNSDAWNSGAADGGG